MMRRGMLAGDTGLFGAVTPPFEAHLAAFVTARQFLAVAGDAFRDYANACIAARRAAPVAAARRP
jgi:hypothetical protein